MMPKLEPSRNPLFDEAVRRWLAYSQNPADAAARSEHNAWLAESERHAEAWELAQRVWRLSQFIGAGPLVATGARQRKPARRISITIAAAAMAACLVLVFGHDLWLMMCADYRAGVGESRDVVLADGSRVQLDSGSAIAADFTADGRGVTLLAGRAFFDVAPDHGRPFLVQAADVSVTVTGTEFDVALGPQEIGVTVSKGSVAVAYSDETKPTIAHLSPGDRLTVDRNGKSARSERVPLSQIAAWRRHWLMVDRATVAAVVAEIARYRTGAVIVTDDVLAGKEVTGVFDLRDPVRALSTVVRPHEGQVREITPWLVLISSSGKSTK